MWLDPDMLGREAELHTVVAESSINRLPVRAVRDPSVPASNLVLQNNNIASLNDYTMSLKTWAGAYNSQSPEKFTVGNDEIGNIENTGWQHRVGRW